MAIQLKRSLSSNLNTNYVLKQGQVGIEMPSVNNTAANPFKFKFGDGQTAWKDLPYFETKVDLSNLVPNSRKINNKNLTADISLSAADVGAATTNHTHTKSQITDFPSSMPASDVYSWAKASSKPSYSASEVGALSKSGGALTGMLSNADSSQVRNIKISTTDLTVGASSSEPNGTIIFVRS